MTHHDALAVAGDHQHVAVSGSVRGALGVERLEVERGAAGELLGLALAQPLPRGALDASSNEPREASSAARRRSPCE